ncbi:MAG: hypothetical protein PARBB_00299 [Parabacteroides distasonis]
MKAVKLFLALFIIGLAALDLQAQDKLTEAQKKIFQERVTQKVEEFQEGLSNIVNDTLTHDIRKENVVNVLKLFMGEGDPYDYYDEELDERIHSTGVRMQTSSVYKTVTQSQKLKNYIHKLYDPETGKSSLAYSKIVIESASAVRVDNIEKVGDHYECVAYFSQKFIGYKDGKVWYSDITGKKIRCYITHIDLPTGKRIFDAKLGDIYVLSTQRL